MPSRGGRGRRAAVDFLVCFGCDGFFRVTFSPIFFFFERTRPAVSMRPSCLIYLSTSIWVFAKNWYTLFSAVLFFIYMITS